METSIVGMTLAAGLIAWLGHRLRRAGILKVGLLNAARRNPHMECLDRMSLSPNHSLHLVQVAGRVLVIGIHPAGCHLLDRWMTEPGDSRRDRPGAEAAHAS